MSLPFNEYTSHIPLILCFLETTMCWPSCLPRITMRAWRYWEGERPKACSPVQGESKEALSLNRQETDFWSRLKKYCFFCLLTYATVPFKSWPGNLRCVHCIAEWHFVLPEAPLRAADGSLSPCCLRSLPREESAGAGWRSGPPQVMVFTSMSSACIRWNWCLSLQVCILRDTLGSQKCTRFLTSFKGEMWLSQART